MLSGLNSRMLFGGGKFADCFGDLSMFMSEPGEDPEVSQQRIREHMKVQNQKLINKLIVKLEPWATGDQDGTN